MGSMNVSREYYTQTVVDKVGSGDCFMGGLIFGLCQGWTPGNVIEFCGPAAFGKSRQELGDSTGQTVAPDYEQVCTITTTPYSKKIREQGLLPLYFHPDSACEALLRALYEGGSRVVELTNRGPEALKNFAHLRSLDLPDMTLVSGPSKRRNRARQFLGAGADFLISPGVPAEVGSVVNVHNHYWVPGCMTPTEAIAAEKLGATLIKLFPGNLLGPAFLASIKDLFPEMAFMPTGGVEPERSNLEAWFKAGCSCRGDGQSPDQPRGCRHPGA